MALRVDPVCPQCRQRNIKWILLTDEVICLQAGCGYRSLLKEHQKQARMGREQHDD
jgi:transcription initiation factor TFIIIB Brf1 subunit/transcription initiation factor TFIIB